MKKLLPATILILFVFSASADIIYVDPNQIVGYRMLRTALAVAENGDEIIVLRGTYNENIDTFGKVITLRSTDPNDPNIVLQTVISARDPGHCVTIDTGEDANTIINGFVITGGNALDGGGIFCDRTSPIIENCIIRNNSAVEGGGIYCYQANPKIINCTFSNNSVDENGGGIFCNEASPTILSCAFSNNSAGKNGGGIYCNQGNPTILNCTFNKNSAGEEGGGLYGVEGDCVVTNCSFNENVAGSGGGMCTAGTNSTIENCTFSNNSAGEDGGGFFSFIGNSAITNCSFNENVAYRGGGACIRNTEETYLNLASIENCTFNKNSTYDSNDAFETLAWGGAIYLEYGGNIVMTDCSFSENSSDSGGAVANIYGDPKFNNCTFTENFVRFGSPRFNTWESGIGGAIFNYKVSSSPWPWSETEAENVIQPDYIIEKSEAVNCIFRKNSAPCAGGAIYDLASMNLINCTFIQNSTSIYLLDGRSEGGAISYGYKSLSSMIKNCLFIANSSELGGAIYKNYTYSYGYEPTIIKNSTFCGNRAAIRGGAIYSYSSNISLENSIFWDNTAEDGNEMSLDRGTIMDANYCDIKGGQDAISGTHTINWGPGNIDVDPYFIAPGYWDSNGSADPCDDFWVDGDYHLLSESLCINTGDPNYVPGPNETDLDGNIRVAEGRIDMGCYESSPMLVNLRILPAAINPGSRCRYITALITMPQGVTPDDVNDDEPLIFTPGQIEAARQFVWQSYRYPCQRTHIMAIFDKSDCMQYLSPGVNEVRVTGRLNNNQYFYGTDDLRVIQLRPWLWRYRSR